MATVTPAQTTSYNMEPKQQLHRHHNNNTKLHTLLTHSYTIQNTLIIPSVFVNSWIIVKCFIICMINMFINNFHVN